ncbi:MAG: alpha-amylase family glycosyl hydrolase [Verrucomicrobiota bacterium]
MMKTFHRVAGLAALFLAAPVLPAAGQSVSNGFWQVQSIYQVITDRYYDGDASNNNAEGNYSATSSQGVHGGDFAGLEKKLDYIKALGATAVWISPVVQNGNGEFHGYAARDFYKVAPHWGTLSNLQHCVQAAHARGLLVINDIVCNHGATLIDSTDSGYCNFLAPPSGYRLRYSGSKTYAPPFDIYNATYNSSNNQLTNLFHNNGCIADYGVTAQVQLGELSGLDDFRTESAYVRSNMAAIYNYWVQNAGFDGFRVDTVKHVELGFWQSWCPQVHQFAATNAGLPNFFMFGEVYDANESLCGSYTGTRGGGAFALDSVLDYPLYFMVNSVFGNGSGATSQIESHYANLGSYYDPAAQMRLVTFLDNHDQARFLNSSTTNRLAVALVFLYTSRGVPCLYYGTEQAFNGATDPNDREDMFAGKFKDSAFAGLDSFNMTHGLFRLVAQLNNFRRLYPALSLGTHINQFSTSGAGLFAYSRRLNAQDILVVLNTAGSTQALPSRTVQYPEGTPLINLLDTNEVITVQAGSQTPPISVPSTGAKIFIAQSQWLPLDPVVVTNFPVHSTTNVPTWTPVTLQFSRPMDTNSVQAAFSISPAAAGTFSWSPALDTVTFTPGAGGLPAKTNVTVSIDASALDATGKPLFARYELLFTTAALSVHDLLPPGLLRILPLSGDVISGPLVVSGTATDNVAVARVEVQLDGGNWQTASGTTSWSYTLNSSNFLNGPHQLATRAADGSGNLSATDTVAVTFFNVPGDYLQRVSGGNPSAVTDCAANVWRADAPYAFGSFGWLGGTNGYVANNIAGVCSSAQPLYQRERYSTSGGGFQYEFDCPEGVYEILLTEAETYWNAAGKRVFNTYIQGRQVLTNYDIFAKTGGQNIPISLLFTNAVTNSQLRILFTPVADNARVSGVQVRKIADVFSDTDGIPDWWRLGYFGHATGSAADNSRGADDADGDGVSNQTEYLNGTSPQNFSSAPVAAPFRITGVNLAGDTVQIQSESAANWNYQLQSRNALDSTPIWTDVGLAMLGTGSLLAFTDTVSGPARFYRVVAR